MIYRRKVCYNQKVNESYSFRPKGETVFAYCYVAIGVKRKSTFVKWKVESENSSRHFD